MKLFWLRSLLPLCFPIVTSAFEKPNLPEGLQFHSDETRLSQALNQGETHESITSATLELIFSQFDTPPELLTVPFARSLRFIQSGESVCITDKIKTPERDKNYLFSLPMSFYQGQKLYQLAKLPPIGKKWLNQKGEVSKVSDVLRVFPNARILLPSHYSFGSQLDDDLATINPNQVVSTATDIYTSYIDMFEAKRVEFTILFPAAVYERYGERLPINVRSYGIEQSSKYITGRFLCSDTPSAREFVKKVNKILLELYQTQAFVDAHQRFLLKPDGDEVLSYIIDFVKSLDGTDQ